MKKFYPQWQRRKRTKRINIRTSKKAFQPKKSLSMYSEAEQQQAVERLWPQELRNMFVISIRPERLKRFYARAKSLGQFVTAWSGVDGRTLEELPPNFPPDMYKGAAGCFLSHISLWKKVVEEKIQFMTILEDDCLLEPHPERLQLVADAMKQASVMEWDIMYLGRNPEVTMLHQHLSQNLARTGYTWGCFAYVVTFRGAQRMLQTCLKNPIPGLEFIVSTTPKNLSIFPIPFLYCTKEISDTLLPHKRADVNVTFSEPLF